jgi:hypothetical protein
MPSGSGWDQLEVLTDLRTGDAQEKSGRNTPTGPLGPIRRWLDGFRRPMGDLM